MNYQKLTSQARGEQPADLVIKNARIPNLFSYEIEEGDVAVSDGVIVGVGRGYEGLQEFDAHGLYLVPGFIESHCHIESTMLTPEGFAELVLPHGTTTVFATSAKNEEHSASAAFVSAAVESSAESAASAAGTMETFQTGEGLKPDTEYLAAGITAQENTWYYQ